MIIVAITLIALLLIGFASHALDDGPERAPNGESHTLDALLFLLCLVGIVAAQRKRARDSEDE